MGFFPLRLSQSLAFASPLDLCVANAGREGRFSVAVPFPFLSLGTFFLVSPSNRIGELPFLLQEFAPRVVVMYFIAAVAFLFYISKVPERYFPGRKFSSG